MTRKHFKALADTLADVRPDSHDHDALRQWRADVERVAGACRSSNPNFDRARFLTACGWEG